MIEATLNAWATELGFDRETVSRRLLKSGYEMPAKGWGKVPAKKIWRAMVGDDPTGKRRLNDAQSEKIERENAIAEGRLIAAEDLEPWLIQNYIAPMTTLLSSAATTLDTRCNPASPETARAAIEDWIENTLKSAMRAGLEKPRRK